MINDEANKCYYFTVKSMLELYSFVQLKNKIAAIINDDNCFQNGLTDALNCQNIYNQSRKNIKY